MCVDRRLEGETPLRQAQLAELYILDVFVEICEKHKLTYFLDGGTFLGAVRHGGFIPWDDDIDIGMPIKDYRRFLKIAPKELPGNLLLTPGKEYSALHPFAKIYDRSSFFCETDTDIRHPCGVYIDIFPFTKQPLLPRRLGYALTRGCTSSWEMNRFHRHRLHRTNIGILYAFLMANLYSAVYWILRTVMYVIGLVRPTRWRNQLGFLMYYHDGFENDVLFPTGHIQFEDKTYACPRDAESFLSSLYGDWRKLPAENERHWHGTILSPMMPPKAAWARPYRVPVERELSK